MTNHVSIEKYPGDALAKRLRDDGIASPIAMMALRQEAANEIERLAAALSAARAEIEEHDGWVATHQKVIRDLQDKLSTAQAEAAEEAAEVAYACSGCEHVAEIIRAHFRALAAGQGGENG